MNRLRRGPARLIALVLLFGALVWLGRLVPRGEHSTQSHTPRPRAEPVPLFEVSPESTPVGWHAWSDSIFARAQRQNKPIVALLDASWSECAQLYAATLAASPRARQALESQVFALRVDIDRRPDVHARYHATFDTVPTLLFMTPRGRLWDVRDALAPGTLLESIQEMSTTRSVADDSEIGLLEASNPQAPQGATPPLHERAAEIFAALVEAWPHPDEILDPDTPILTWNALGFLRTHAEATNAPESRALFLQGLRQLLASPLLRDGAFWRDVEGAPDRVSRAALLETQAALLDHFDTAARWTNDPVYREAADGVGAFLLETLWDERHGLFRAAQSTLVVNDNGWPVLTGEEFASVRAHDSAHLQPLVVPIYPIAGNARACRALLAIGDGRRAWRALEGMWNAYESLGFAPHDFAVGPDGNLQPSAHDYALDHAELGTAFLMAATLAANPASAREWIARATAVARGLIEDFSDPGSHVFRDARVPREPVPERMHVRLTPLVENARAAQFLSTLTAHTGDARYDDAAQAALETWNPSLWSRSIWEACEFGIAVLR